MKWEFNQQSQPAIAVRISLDLLQCNRWSVTYYECYLGRSSPLCSPVINNTPVFIIIEMLIITHVLLYSYSSTPTILHPPSHLRSLPGLSCPCVHDLLSSVQQSVSTGFWERRTVMSYSHHLLRVMVVVKGGMITYHHHHYHWTILSRKPPDVWAAATNWSPTFTREWGVRRDVKKTPGQTCWHGDGEGTESQHWYFSVE